MNEWKLRSYAKINLYLSVIKKTGNFHEIDSLFHKIVLHDTITVKEAETFEIRAAGKYKVPVDSSNILFRVFKRINTIKKLPNFHIKIEKRIPVGAGLGGGSSNAAAFIIFLQNRYNIFADLMNMLRFGHEIGKDVTFFLIPQNAARIMGVQNIIFPIDLKCEKKIKIFFPNKDTSTKEVYEIFDEQAKVNLTNSKKISKILHSVKKCLFTELNDLLFNDLEPAFFCLNKDLKAIYEMIKLKSEFALLSGSGAAVFFKPKSEIQLPFNIIDTKLLGCRQVARQRFLVPLFGGSNPSTPAKICI